MRNSKLTSFMIICELFTYFDCYDTIVGKIFCSFVSKFEDEISFKQMQDLLNNSQSLKKYLHFVTVCPSVETTLDTYERL